MIRILKNWLLTIIALLTFAWLTLAPHPLPVSDTLSLFPGADKVVHMLMLWGITCSVIFDYKRVGKPSPRMLTPKVFITVFLSMLVLSIGDEVLQFAMGLGRTGDLLDLAADVVGICIALISAPTIVNTMLHRYRF
jgi:hypothetical protein